MTLRVVEEDIVYLSSDPSYIFARTLERGQVAIVVPMGDDLPIVVTIPAWKMMATMEVGEGQVVVQDGHERIAIDVLRPG